MQHGLLLSVVRGLHTNFNFSISYYVILWVRLLYSFFNQNKKWPIFFISAAIATHNLHHNLKLFIKNGKSRCQIYM